MYVCLFYLFIYIYIYIYIFTILQVLELGAAFSVVDYVLVVVVEGCGLGLWVFQEILVVGMGCIQT